MIFISRQFNEAFFSLSEVFQPCNLFTLFQSQFVIQIEEVRIYLDGDMHPFDHDIVACNLNASWMIHVLHWMPCKGLFTCCMLWINMSFRNYQYIHISRVKYTALVPKYVNIYSMVYLMLIFISIRIFLRILTHYDLALDDYFTLLCWCQHLLGHVLLGIFITVAKNEYIRMY